MLGYEDTRILGNGGYKEIEMLDNFFADWKQLTTPPASATMSAPAAMSQQWIPV